MSFRLPVKNKLAVAFVSFSLVFCMALNAQEQQKYVVQQGDTYYSISRKFSVSLDELLSANKCTKDTPLLAGASLVIPGKDNAAASSGASSGSTGAEYGVHTVLKGETAYSISRQYGVPLDELYAVNGMKKDDPIFAGQTLSIPQKNAAKTDSKTSKTTATSSGSAPQNSDRKFDTYTVQKGDTIYRIATVNGIKPAELLALNPDVTAESLKPGQNLKIPVTIVDTKNTSLPDLPSSDPRKYTGKTGNSNLEWPVKNPVVTYMTGKVSGVQLSAQKNEKVTAIRAGTVMYVGNYRGYGQVVFVQSKTGHVYVYSGLGSIAVKKGDYVVFGDNIGTAGTDSIKGTSQISLMVFQKSNPIDPAKAPRG